jgi:hypothetical protein
MEDLINFKIILELAEKQLKETTDENYKKTFSNWESANRIFIIRSNDFIKKYYGKDLIDFIVPPYKKSDDEQ